MLSTSVLELLCQKMFDVLELLVRSCFLLPSQYFLLSVDFLFKLNWKRLTTWEGQPMVLSASLQSSAGSHSAKDGAVRAQELALVTELCEPWPSAVPLGYWLLSKPQSCWPWALLLGRFNLGKQSQITTKVCLNNKPRSNPKTPPLKLAFIQKQPLYNLRITFERLSLYTLTIPCFIT